MVQLGSSVNMPGIAGTSPASLEHLGRPLFRAHKSLPRRPNGDPSVHVIHASPSDPIVDTSNGGAHAPAPALPLTPPGVPPDESPTPKALEMQKLASPHSMSGTVTPSRPSHPPTPETTPPRLPATTYRPGIGGQFLQASCSSRAESFQTACEMISDGETETPHRSSPSSRQSTRQRPLQKSVQSEPKDGRPEDATSVVDHSDAMLLKPSRYEGINGEWATENTDRFAASRQRRRRSRNHPSDTPLTTNVLEQPQDTYSTSAHDLNVPRTRERNVRVRVRDAQDTGASPYSEQYSQKVDWSPPEGRTDSYNHDDTCRFSGVSTSSTIEVMIVDTPEPYKPSLRHTEKRVSLRSTSSPITRSERGSLVSNPDSQHRLVHKAARISENDRRSIASEISISEDSTQGGPRQHVEVVPVVVIPERHSSLKSSASISRNPSNASSQPSSHRTRTRSGSRPESVDRPPQKRRTLSNSSEHTHQDTDCRGRSLGRPIIPPRSSSLSAPTSQNNSRATSLTSVSSRNQPTAVETEKQNQQPEPPMPEPKKAPLVRDRADVLKTQSILIGVEDMAHLRSPSGAFTLGSIPSSSPGLVEISEATLVPFFPHNNESLLLVDPQHRPGAQGLAIRVEYQGSPAKPEFPPSPRQEETYSLQNPRQPPNPPVCKVSPPTPVNEADREPEMGTRNGETGEQVPRRFGSIRRPWKLRPRSDSFNSIARSFSVTSAKNRMAGKDIDGKLHPFWRPRRFWEDTSESEDQSPREQNFRPPTLEADQVISNSLGMPQQRVVFQGPPISPRSIDTKRSFDEAVSRRQARDSLVGSRVFMPEALYSQTSLHQRRYRSLSWWRLRLRFGSVRSFRKRLRRSWQQRAEGKREARREALKQSIGEAVLIDNSWLTRSMVQ